MVELDFVRGGQHGSPCLCGAFQERRQRYESIGAGYGVGIRHAGCLCGQAVVRVSVLEHSDSSCRSSVHRLVEQHDAAGIFRLRDCGSVSIGWRLISLSHLQLTEAHLRQSRHHDIPATPSCRGEELEFTILHERRARLLARGCSIDFPPPVPRLYPFRRHLHLTSRQDSTCFRQAHFDRSRLHLHHSSPPTRHFPPLDCSCRRSSLIRRVHTRSHVVVAEEENSGAPPATCLLIDSTRPLRDDHTREIWRGRIRSDETGGAGAG